MTLVGGRGARGASLEGVKPILLLALVPVALSGCASISTFYPPNDLDTFAAAVAAWHLDGMSVAEAASLLESKRYTVVGRYPPPNRLVRDQRDGFYALRSKATALLCSREWRIVARIEGDRLVETKALIVEGCTGP